MHVREAIVTDSDRIRAIAKRSFEASYALSPLDIETVLEAEFDDGAIGARIEDGEVIVIVVEADGTLIGFGEARIRNDQRGELRWLHIDPPERGNGAATELMEEMIAKLRERAVVGIDARILVQNKEGGEFLERFAFESKEQTERMVGEEPFTAEVYTNTDTNTDTDTDTEPS